ncbi:MAG: hypothetical protein U9R69_11890 [Thermodesulfobacteriota bacterium]|nr:hypothetical protein [Thermodesulfobacteriota bacterium]
MGKRDELVGGGLRRVLKLAGDGEGTTYDDRLLDAHIPQPDLIRCVAEFAGVDPEEIGQSGKKTRVSDIKGIIYFLATHRLGYSGEAVAKALALAQEFAGATRGSALIVDKLDKWMELEKLINKSTALRLQLLAILFRRGLI